MNLNLYTRCISLLLTVVFAACGDSHADKADTTQTADSLVVPPNDNSLGNNHTFDRPPGDSNAMIKDSLYNADSAKHRPYKRVVPEK